VDSYVVHYRDVMSSLSRSATAAKKRRFCSIFSRRREQFCLAELLLRASRFYNMSSCWACCRTRRLTRRWEGLYTVCLVNMSLALCSLLFFSYLLCAVYFCTSWTACSAADTIIPPLHASGDLCKYFPDSGETYSM